MELGTGRYTEFLMAELRDGFGRVATDLRVSVTDRCNFRCTYCMPQEGMTWIPHEEVLSFDEMARLVRIGTTLGIRRVRLTGGEPLVRPRLELLVEKLSAMGLDDLSITTNGTLLEQKAELLAAAGLRRVNVSMDSLLRERFLELTRRDALTRVMAGLEAAEAAGLGPIKVNCVVVRGVNDSEIIHFAKLVRRTGWDVRFIEWMPLDAGDTWEHAKVVPASEIIDAIGERWPLLPIERTAAPATQWRFADGTPGRIGTIASVTEPFCETCDRVRLTADGQFRTCLFAHSETDMRGQLRAGATDEEIALLMVDAVAVKAQGHLINQVGFRRPDRPMSAIGG